MNSNIYLVGYRGTGKSSLGKKIAKLLGWQLVDLDKEIVKKSGKSIPQLFSELGEPYFRDLEREALLFFGEKTNQVIATGGGVVVNEKNRLYLKNRPFVVWLKGEVGVLYDRIYGDKNRPALTNLDPLEEIKKTMQIREPYYKEVSDLTFDTSYGPFQIVAEKIVTQYLKKSS